jgi:hypothetical protein
MKDGVAFSMETIQLYEGIVRTFIVLINELKSDSAYVYSNEYLT